MLDHYSFPYKMGNGKMLGMMSHTYHPFIRRHTMKSGLRDSKPLIQWNARTEMKRKEKCSNRHLAQSLVTKFLNPIFRLTFTDMCMNTFTRRIKRLNKHAWAKISFNISSWYLSLYVLKYVCACAFWQSIYQPNPIPVCAFCYLRACMWVRVMRYITKMLLLNISKLTWARTSGIRWHVFTRERGW